MSLQGDVFHLKKKKGKRSVSTELGSHLTHSVCQLAGKENLFSVERWQKKKKSLPPKKKNRRRAFLPHYESIERDGWWCWRIAVLGPLEWSIPLRAVKITRRANILKILVAIGPRRENGTTRKKKSFFLFFVGLLLLGECWKTGAPDFFFLRR